MYAGIGTPRARQDNRTAQERLDSAAQLARNRRLTGLLGKACLLYTSDAADE